MKALTIWQPWATLCVLPNPETGRPYKTIETRSWKAPDSLIGQRIAIHAAKRDTDNDPSIPVACWDALGEVIGGDAPPRGAIVGTAVLAACLPMVAERNDDAHILVTDDGLWEAEPTEYEDVSHGAMLPSQNAGRIDEERPYGHFEPGRFGWLLTDVRPFDTPIPATGKQGLWNWETP